MSKMLDQQKGDDYSLLRVATTFGLGAAFRIYAFGVLVGGWLDEKLGVSPWFTMGGILLGIFMSFKLLFDELFKGGKESEPGGNSDELV